VLQTLGEAIDSGSDASLELVWKLKSSSRLNRKLVHFQLNPSNPKEDSRFLVRVVLLTRIIIT
jgi:hypothetical protein